MGTYAHANLVYGFAYEPETGPPGWLDGYDEVNLSKVPAELREAWDEDDGLGELVYELADKYSLLSYQHHGNLESGWTGFAIHVARLRYRGSVGEVFDLPAELGVPTEEEFEQLREVAGLFGDDMGHCGWKFLVDYS